MLPIQKETVSDIVARYAQMMEALEDLHTVAEECSKIFKAFDGYGYYMTFENHNGYEKSKNKATAHIWHEIIDKTGIREVMTETRLKELDSTIAAGKMPPVTVDNIYTVLSQLYDRAPELLQEFAEECYNLFIPSRWSKLKTSSDGEIKNHGILQNVFDTSYYFALSYYGRGIQKLKTLENTFSMLDGKGIVTDEKETLFSKINEKIKAGEKTLETEYFKLKWFTNSNLHVEFKRLDLLKQLNAIGAKNRLKQTA